MLAYKAAHAASAPTLCEQDTTVYLAPLLPETHWTNDVSQTLKRYSPMLMLCCVAPSQEMSLPAQRLSNHGSSTCPCGLP